MYMLENNISCIPQLPANRSAISPEAKRSLMSTKKPSSGTCASVSRNTVPMFFRPALMYSWARSACVHRDAQSV